MQLPSIACGHKKVRGSLFWRERVIRARREVAERSEVSASLAVKYLKRWRDNESAVAKPHGGSISPLEKLATQILTVIAEQPDRTLVESAAVLRKRRIRTGRSMHWRFLDRPNIKKVCTPRNGSASPSRARVGLGSESKAFLNPLGGYLSTRPRSAPIGAPQGQASRGASD